MTLNGLRFWMWTHLLSGACLFLGVLCAIHAGEGLTMPAARWEEIATSAACSLGSFLGFYVIAAECAAREQFTVAAKNAAYDQVAEERRKFAQELQNRYDIIARYKTQLAKGEGHANQDSSGRDDPGADGHGGHLRCVGGLRSETGSGRDGPDREGPATEEHAAG